MQNHETKKGKEEISVAKLRQLIRAISLLRKLLEKEHEAKQMMMSPTAAAYYPGAGYPFSNNWRVAGSMSWNTSESVRLYCSFLLAQKRTLPASGIRYEPDWRMGFPFSREWREHPKHLAAASPMRWDSKIVLVTSTGALAVIPTGRDVHCPDFIGIKCFRGVIFSTVSKGCFMHFITLFLSSSIFKNKAPLKLQGSLF